MQIVMLNGGLGNQVFQYIFFRWLEVRSRERCIIDDSAFFGHDVMHGGYEMERVFSVCPQRLSERFPADVWDMMIRKMNQGIPVCQQLLDAGMDLEMIYEPRSGEVKFSGQRTDFRADIMPISGLKDHYYFGYWIGTCWLREIGGIIESELRFPPLPAGYNEKIGQMICTSHNPVAIHIRRGDMVQLAGMTSEPEYYRQRISWLERKGIDHYFLFSDDLDWCRAHAEVLGLSSISDRLTVVEGNQGQFAYVDMQLMSLCHHRLSDRSSFSLLAGILCRWPDKVEINHWQ